MVGQDARPTRGNLVGFHRFRNPTYALPNVNTLAHLW